MASVFVWALLQKTMGWASAGFDYMVTHHFWNIPQIQKFGCNVEIIPS